MSLLADSEGDVNLNILIKFTKNRNHPVKREPAKLGVANTGEFGVRHAGNFSPDGICNPARNIVRWQETRARGPSGAPGSTWRFR